MDAWEAMLKIAGGKSVYSAEGQSKDFFSFVYLEQRNDSESVLKLTRVRVLWDRSLTDPPIAISIRTVPKGYVSKTGGKWFLFEPGILFSKFCITMKDTIPKPIVK